jgi:hypothetical protein
MCETRIHPTTGKTLGRDVRVSTIRMRNPRPALDLVLRYAFAWRGGFG